MNTLIRLVKPTIATEQYDSRKNAKKFRTFAALMTIAVSTILSGVIFFDVLSRLKNGMIQPNQCKQISNNTRNKFIPVAKRPPWFEYMKESNAEIKFTEVQRYFYLTGGMAETGRLGNRLFLYASLFGIAWRNPRRIPLWNYDQFGLNLTFSQLRINADHKSPYRNDQFTSIDEPSWSEYLNVTEHLPPTNIHLNGFLLHTRYFAHVEDQLRFEFTFSADVRRQAQSMLDALGASSLREAGHVRVVIHVRRGDTQEGTDRFLERDPAFFNRSMAYFTDCLPKVHFIVISDDIPWCRQNIFGHRVDFIDGERSPAVDLAIASLCDHAIMTVGTFGWWAAWFANGVTLQLYPESRN